MNRAFIIDGRRAYRLVALLILVLGTVMLAGGLIMSSKGSTKLDELRPVTGKLNLPLVNRVLRDELALMNRNIADLEDVVRYGSMFKKYSWFLILPGMVFLIEPILLFKLMTRLKIDRERTP